MSPTLDYLERPLLPFMRSQDIEEICIQEPNVAWTFGKGEFARHDVEGLDRIWIEDLAIVAGAQRRIDVGIHNRPLLDTAVGFGRLGAVFPPCVAGCPALTIRRGSAAWPTLAELGAGGLFRNTRAKRKTKGKSHDMLVDLYKAEKWEEFFRAAVLAKKTIIGCGVTASGKTHLSKALINEIPRHERLIVIEDSPELREIPHPNHVSLYYDKNAGKDGVGATNLVEASLRMRPERLFIQEVRDGQTAIALFVALQTGQSGGMTTVHASHCEAAFSRLRVLIKQAGAAISDDDITSELHELVDIVVHSSREDGPFEVDEVWFRPVSLDEKGE